MSGGKEPKRKKLKLERQDSSGPSSSSQESVPNASSQEAMEMEVNHNNPDPIHYKIVPSKEIFTQMEEIVNDVRNVTSQPSSIVMVLLNHVHWDKEQYFAQLYADDNSEERMLKAANVIPKDANLQSLQQSKSTKKTTATTLTCDICFDTIELENSFGMSCSHQFCRECWKNYLTTQVMDEGASHLIHCPASGCNVVVQYEMVQRLVEDEDVFEKYRLLVAKNFVESSKRLTWCPGVGCNNVAVMESGSFSRWVGVHCLCGNYFCFICGKDWHEPISCEYLKKWLQKFQDDSETANWMQANTKDCPKCHTVIEKNGGCNHMICRNKCCNHNFCWICLEDWTSHRGDAYNCNRFNETKSAGVGKARTSLNRYLHYYERYVAHFKSFKFEDKLRQEIEAKMKRFQVEWKMTWVDVQFLPKAAEILSKCRRTLMYTYSFAFFLAQSNQSQLFEDNQRDLESTTENLGSYLENEVPEIETPTDFKSKVLHWSQYCESRRKVLIKHVNDGYENEENPWTYRPDDIPSTLADMKRID